MTPEVTKRKRISNADRNYIYKRDGFKCVYCGSNQKISVDHKIPVRLGGNNTRDNFVTACMQCNIKKGARLGIDLKKQVLVLNSSNKLIEEVDVWKNLCLKLFDEQKRDKQFKKTDDLIKKISTEQEALAVSLGINLRLSTFDNIIYEK